MAASYNDQIFFDSVRASLFPSGMSQQQVDGMNALLSYLDSLDWVPGRGVDDPSQNTYFHYWNAYNFATTFHETAYTMWPVTEYGSDAYLKSKRYYPYIGRGFVQMTWKSNYQRSDREIAEGDLISTETLSTLPGNVVNQTDHWDQALNLEIASCNLMIGCWKGWWTGKKLWDYLRNDSKDYINARRIVNGTDRASKIAGHAEAFEEAFLAAWQRQPHEVPPVELPPPMPEPCPPPEDGAPAVIADELVHVYGDLEVRYKRV